jgi:DNA-binding MarR family transcriptional regulator
MIPKALITAATDPALRPNGLAVYTLLHAHLDYLEYRPIKQAWLARQLQMAAPHLSNAIRALCERGYLERRGNGAGAIARYRIPVSPRRFGAPSEPPG